MQILEGAFTRVARGIIAVGLVLGAFGSSATEAGMVYSISNSITGSSAQNGWTIAGTIELKDSTAFGAITGSDIKSWQWTASKPNTTSVSANLADGSTYLFTYPAGNIKATATGLYFKNGVDVSLGLNGNSGAGLGWGNNPVGNVYVSIFSAYDAGENQLFALSPSGLPLDATYGYQFATPRASGVPEIDPATGGSALSLVAGVLAMIEQRRRRVAASRA